MYSVLTMCVEQEHKLGLRGEQNNDKHPLCRVWQAVIVFGLSFNLGNFRKTDKVCTGSMNIGAYVPSR